MDSRHLVSGAATVIGAGSVTADTAHTPDASATIQGQGSVTCDAWVMVPRPLNPHNLLRLAKAVAGLPRDVQRQSMLNIIHERLRVTATDAPAPSAKALLACYPGGLAGYWGDWLNHPQLTDTVPIARVLAIHAAKTPATVREIQRRLDRWLTPQVVADPAALRRLLMHPALAFAICDELRSWLTEGAESGLSTSNAILDEVERRIAGGVKKYTAAKLVARENGLFRSGVMDKSVTAQIVRDLHERRRRRRTA